MKLYKSRRYKVQKRVDLLARDRSNKPFLLGVLWRTVSEADRKAHARAVKARQEAVHPAREFRVAEEWPLGTEARPLP